MHRISWAARPIARSASSTTSTSRALRTPTSTGIMRISQTKPKVVSGFRWERAIPQYTLGHEERLAMIELAVSRIPGLRLAGNYLRGVSVPDCIRRANEIAAALYP